MPTKYIVTLCFTDRTHKRFFADIEEVREVMENFFADEEAVSFVISENESPWRKARGLDIQED